MNVYRLYYKQNVKIFGKKIGKNLQIRITACLSSIKVFLFVCLWGKEMSRHTVSYWLSCVAVRIRGRLT